MEPPVLEGERRSLAQKVMGAGPHLDVELEPRAQVPAENVGISETHSAVHERHAAAAGGEVVTEDRRKAKQGPVRGIRLCPTPEFAQQLGTTPEPLLLPHDAAEDP